jgi:hypothetical protein
VTDKVAAKLHHANVFYLIPNNKPGGFLPGGTDSVEHVRRPRPAIFRVRQTTSVPPIGTPSGGVQAIALGRTLGTSEGVVRVGDYPWQVNHVHLVNFDKLPTITYCVIHRFSQTSRRIDRDSPANPAGGVVYRTDKAFALRQGAGNAISSRRECPLPVEQEYMSKECLPAQTISQARMRERLARRYAPRSHRWDQDRFRAPRLPPESALLPARTGFARENPAQRAPIVTGGVFIRGIPWHLG